MGRLNLKVTGDSLKVSLHFGKRHGICIDECICVSLVSVVQVKIVVKRKCH